MVSPSGARRGRGALQAVHDSDGQGERTDRRVATDTGTGRGGDPVLAASVAVRAEHDRLAGAKGKLRIAAARLDETLSAAPPVSAHVAAAEAQVADAARRAEAGLVDAAEAHRRAKDAAGAVRVAQARVDDLGPGSTGAQQVGATEGLAKAERASDAAEEDARRAEETRQDAENDLAGAEDTREQLRGLPALETAAVVTAREGVATARRACDTAQQQCLLAEAVASKLRDEAGAVGPDGQPQARLRFASLPAFVELFVMPNWARPYTARTYWCHRWWEHPEALTRLDVLWGAFEVMRLEPPPSMSTWMRDHFDHHMSVLTREEGPFARCNTGDRIHERLPAWHVDRPNPDSYESEPTAQFQLPADDEGATA